MARCICILVVISLNLGSVGLMQAENVYRLERMVTARSLFGDNLNRSVADLIEDHSVGASID